MVYICKTNKTIIGITLKKKNMIMVLLVITGVACFGLLYKCIDFFDKI